MKMLKKGGLEKSEARFKKWKINLAGGWFFLGKMPVIWQKLAKFKKSKGNGRCRGEGLEDEKIENFEKKKNFYMGDTFFIFLQMQKYRRQNWKFSFERQKIRKKCWYEVKIMKSWVRKWKIVLMTSYRKMEDEIWWLEENEEVWATQKRVTHIK